MTPKPAFRGVTGRWRLDGFKKPRVLNGVGSKRVDLRRAGPTAMAAFPFQLYKDKGSSWKENKIWVQLQAYICQAY